MTITALLDSIHQHMATFDLPEPWSVTVRGNSGQGRERVCVQLTSGVLPQVAASLLAWADTLTEDSAEAWRVPSGDSVHLDILGQLADGTKVRVFDGVEHDSALFELEPKERQTVSLGCLREWAALGKGVAA
jgi:hypothetical protein